MTVAKSLVFSDGKKTSITIPYSMITALAYGLERAHRGAYGYPWDSYEQFTKKRHYVLTIVFQPPQETATQAVAFELERGVVKPGWIGCRPAPGRRSRSPTRSLARLTGHRPSAVTASQASWRG